MVLGDEEYVTVKSQSKNLLMLITIRRLTFVERNMHLTTKPLQKTILRANPYKPSSSRAIP